jgi:hypothetical protein
MISPRLRVELMPGQYPYTIHAGPLELVIVPIPDQGRPPDFSGAVGSFHFSATLAPTNVVVGELLTARLSINGTGDLTGATMPRFSPGRHFRIYEPVRVPGTADGQTVFEQTLVPLSTQATLLPAVSFSFFDPDTAAYRSITQGPFNLSFRAPTNQPRAAYRPPDAGPTAGPDTASETSPGTERPMPGRVRRALSIGSFWLVTGALALRVGRRKRHGTALALTIVALAALVFPLLLRFIERAGDGSPAARTQHTTTLHLAPADSALVTAHVPQEEPVLVLTRHGRWAKIQHGNKRGWIRAVVLDL